MLQVFYVISGVVKILVGGVELLMILRLMLSLLPPETDGSVGDFVYGVTECVIFPVRFVLERFSFFAENPVDLSATITFFILLALLTIL